MSMYLLLVVNGNGESEVVGSFLVSDETRDTISTMVHAFKQCDASCENVIAIMLDKDFVEWSVKRDKFLRASLITCLSHALWTFSREVTGTCDHMGLRPPQHDLSGNIAEERLQPEFVRIKTKC